MLFFCIIKYPKVCHINYHNRFNTNISTKIEYKLLSTIDKNIETRTFSYLVKDRVAACLTGNVGCLNMYGYYGFFPLQCFMNFIPCNYVPTY